MRHMFFRPRGPLGLVIFVLFFVFWVRMLISAIENKGLSDTEKVCWVLAVIFLPVLGAVLYYFIGHPKRLTPRTGT